MKLNKTLINIKKTKNYPFGLFLNPYDDDPIPINYDIFRNKTFMWSMDGCTKELERFPLFVNNVYNKYDGFFSQYKFILNKRIFYFHKNEINKKSKHHNLYYKR